MDGPVVILVGTSHPGNAGACARVAANFGASELRFVAPRCDVFHEEAYQRAVHAKALLEAARERGAYGTLRAALEGLSLSVGTTARVATGEGRFLRKTMDVRDWADGLGEWDGRIGVVFGREDFGLSADEVNLLDQLVTIPTADYQSLNLSHAVGIIGYELMRVRAASRTPERTLSPDELQTLHQAWDCLVDETEPRAWRKQTTKGLWRKVIGRSRPDDHEVHALMGILGNALKRFQHPDYANPTSQRILAQRGLLVARPGPLPAQETDGAEGEGGDRGPSSP